MLTTVRVPTIYVVDDDPAVAHLVGRIAGKTGLRVMTSTNPRMTLEHADVDSIDLAIVDVHMPGLSGPDMVQELRAHGHNCPVLFMSGDLTVDAADSALQIAGASFLPKPFTAAELSTAIWEALAQR